MPNIYFKWSLVDFFNFDVFLSLKVILILINSTDPDELPHFRSSLFAFRIQILPYMGVCILYSEAYLRKHPKADEKLIETQMTATLKQGCCKKQLKLNACVPKKQFFRVVCNFMRCHCVPFNQFFSIWVIHKCKSGIDFLLACPLQNSSFMDKISMTSQVFSGKTWK